MDYPCTDIQHLPKSKICKKNSRYIAYYDAAIENQDWHDSTFGNW